MSSVPNNERPWAPAELDAIEDALEHLDVGQLPATLSAEQAQRIGERVASYRAIAAMSRELLTGYAPPASALAAVMAEARAAASAPVVASAPATSERASWWTRARRLWLVPAFASAGVGALVVALSVTREPSDAAEQVASVSADAKREQAPMAAPNAAVDDRPSSGLALSDPAALPPAEASDGAAPRGAAAQPAAPTELSRGRLRERGDDADKSFAGEKDIADGDARDERERPADEDAEERKTAGTRKREEPAAPATKRPAVDPRPEPPKAPSKGAPPSPKPSAGGGAPGSGSAEAPSTAALGDLLVRADRARRSGDCAAARRDYELVMSRGDAKQRARAKAGTALCLERSGAQASAADMLAGARLDDPAIDAWLASERARGE